jgi:hypothetical protein
MEKLYNEKGQVAVAVSYGFGAGWSTWNDVNPMDKRYNELILNEEWEKAEELAEKEGHYAGGLCKCEIEWVNEGVQFDITEYDGSESLMPYSDLRYKA